MWLRFSGNVFIVWTWSESEFNRLVNFCNNYAINKDYISKIKFTLSRPSKAAAFEKLRLKFKVLEYLRTYFVNPLLFPVFGSVIHNIHHVSISLSKSQFMRIRRVYSSDLKNYDKHAALFIRHFCKRGYSECKLKLICENVRNKDVKKGTRNLQKGSRSNRVTIVLPLHHNSERSSGFLQWIFLIL